MNPKKFLIFVSVILVVFAIFGIHWLFFDIDRLPKGVFLTEVKSPNTPLCFDRLSISPLKNATLLSTFPISSSGTPSTN